MKTIYKYPIKEIKSQFRIDISKGAKILTVQIQRGMPMIWAIIDTDQGETEDRIFRIIGTGHDIDLEDKEFLDYIGTFQMAEGNLVWHLFELINIK